MSTQFTNRQWRLPNEENKSKVSNYSMDFDGSGYISVTPIVLTDFTVSFWINPSTIIGASYDGILGQGTTAAQGGILRYVAYDGNTSTGSVILYLGGSWSNVASLTNGVWSNVILTYDSTANELKSYKNGSLDTTISSPNFSGQTTNAHSFVDIGRRNGTSGSIFNGQIDAVAIYNYALSSSQITTLYGSSSTGIGNPMSLSPKPVAYYPLGDQDAFNGADYLVPNSSLKDYVFDFVANGDTISIPDSNELDLSGTDFSISFWVNPNSISGSQMILQKYSGSTGWAIYNKSTANSLQFYQAGSFFALDTNSIDNNIWSHYVVTANVSASEYKIYKNGSLINTLSRTINITSSTQPLYIGSLGGTGFYYNGLLSNISILNTTLPATGSNSVETLYNNGSPLTSMSGFTSLQGWWKLDASATFDSSTNTWTIPDDSTNSNTGTSSGMTQANLVQSDLSFTSGYSPYALDFDGASSDAITLGNTIGNSFTQITCSIWANISTSGLTQSTYRNFLVKFPTGGFSATPFELRSSNGNRVDTYNNKLFFRVNTNTGGYGFTDTGFEFTEANKWHHLVGTYDGSNVKLFVDGVEYYSISASGTLNSNPNNATIGKSGSTGDFNGKLSNASIWNVALTSAQVTELYNEGVPSNLNNHSAYSNLVSWWQLGSNSSFNTNWTVLDEKGSNNGTSVNMGEDAIVDGVGSYANGLSSGMGGDEVIGDAPYSTANALSVNMDVEDRVTDTPS